MSATDTHKQDGDLRRRLRELLAVPERERTDAQWDEIVEIEVRLAPGNKIDSTKRMTPAPAQPPGRQPSGKRPAQRPSGKRPGRSGR